MATVQDLTLEVFLEIESDKAVKDDERIYHSIKSFQKELRGEGVSGKSFGMYTMHELSILQGELSLYKDVLGDITARAERNRKICENIISVKKDNYRKDAEKALIAGGIKPTESSIKHKLESLLFKANTRLAVLGEYENRYKQLGYAVHGNLQAIDRRIEVLLSDRMNAPKGNNFMNVDLPSLGDNDIVETPTPYKESLPEKEEFNASTDKLVI